MLAPVVAAAPTTDVGRCWSIAPRPLPVTDDGSLADWVEGYIDDNISALLIAGGVGLGVAAVTAMVVNRSVRAPIKMGQRGTRISLAVTALVLLFGWWLIQNWGDFNTHAHGFAASPHVRPPDRRNHRSCRSSTGTNGTRRGSGPIRR